MKKLTVEDSVSVSGFIQPKESKLGKEQQWELVVENFQILNSSNLDAAQLDKLKHNNPQDIPPQFRYLQLRTPYYQKSLRLRSEAARLIRDIFIKTTNLLKLKPRYYSSRLQRGT